MYIYPLPFGLPSHSGHQREILLNGVIYILSTLPHNSCMKEQRAWTPQAATSVVLLPCFYHLLFLHHQVSMFQLLLWVHYMSGTVRIFVNELINFFPSQHGEKEMVGERHWVSRFCNRSLLAWRWQLLSIWIWIKCMVSLVWSQLSSSCMRWDRILS